MAPSMSLMSPGIEGQIAEAEHLNSFRISVRFLDSSSTCPHGDIVFGTDHENVDFGMSSRMYSNDINVHASSVRSQSIVIVLLPTSGSPFEKRQRPKQNTTVHIQDTYYAQRTRV